MINTLKSELLKTLETERDLTHLPAASYSSLKYPKLFPLMRFKIDEYTIEDQCHVMIMHTTSKVGMELLTLSFSPVSGNAVPYFLLDAMSVKEKRCVFAEFYGCGHEGLSESALNSAADIHRTLPEYAEKPAWYISERETCSLIKSGSAEELVTMAADMVSAYLKDLNASSPDETYKKELAAFRERLITEGNPSSATLKLLFKKNADEFMRNVIFPIH